MISRLITIMFISLFCLSVQSQEKTESLDDLVKRVKKERTLENQEHLKREKRFKAEKNKQFSLLKKAQMELEKEETRSKRLRNSYEMYDNKIAAQESLLDEKIGSLRELHGVVRQIASDVDVVIDTSIVSAQKPGRDETIDKLADSKELPTIEELENLWLLVLDEMAESAKVVTFPAKIITNTGNEVEQNVTRVGVFNAVSNGHYLRYLSDTAKLVEPGRQPTTRLQSMASKLEDATTGIHSFPIDPTRGSMLALLVQLPNVKERIQQGGLVGYVIIFVAFIGLLITFERFYILTRTNKRIQKQLKSKQPGDNPLGHIMKVYSDNPDVDNETLEFKLDEAILKELPLLQRRLAALALLAAIAPLLGLLGTVTGIIETFQSITLFGTGDPRAMSEGISQALVTTVMGLVVAIPLLLFHSFLSGKSNQLIQILDEKSKSFVALLAEINRLKNAHM